MTDIANPPFAGLGSPEVIQREIAEDVTAKQAARRYLVPLTYEMCERNTRAQPPYHLRQERVMSESGARYTKVTTRGVPVIYFRAGIGTRSSDGQRMFEAVAWPIESE